MIDGEILDLQFTARKKHRSRLNILLRAVDYSKLYRNSTLEQDLNNPYSNGMTNFSTLHICNKTDKTTLYPHAQLSKRRP